MIIFFIILAVPAILALWVASTYNRLVGERLKVQTQWSQIDVVLKQRSDLIPNLVETVKGYAAHEREVFQDDDARTRYMGAENQREAMAAGIQEGNAPG